MTGLRNITQVGMISQRWWRSGQWRAASRASSVRLATPSFAYACERCTSTVLRDMNSPRAMSGLLRPWLASSATCRSTGLRLAHPRRGARMLPAAALGVGDGLLKRQPGPLLECIFKILRRPVQCRRRLAAARFVSGGREGQEPEDAPLLASRGNEPGGPLMLAPEQSDIGEDVEGVDDCGTPSAVHEYLERVLSEGLCPLIVTLKQQGTGQPEVGYCLGAPVPQGFGGGQQLLDVDLGPVRCRPAPALRRPGSPEHARRGSKPQIHAHRGWQPVVLLD